MTETTKRWIMKLGHEVCEGERIHFGLNWWFPKHNHTQWRIVLLLPLFFTKATNYWSFDMDGVYHGFRVLSFHLYLRKRNQERFSNDWPIFIHDYSFEWMPIFNQTLITTREYLVDHKMVAPI